MNTELSHTPRPLVLGPVPVPTTDYGAIGAKILADMRAEHVVVLSGMTESVARRILHHAHNAPLLIDPTAVHFALVTLGEKE